ncbi:hypothetical protein [Sphingomonas adhaesiva]|uniref:hypothetical protein n=1 Tax=Sphingomonas adhaesiva TaxID=28212 RepID=UPI002FF4CB74
MRATGIKHPPMPINPATHITDRLVEMGLTEAAGMAAVPLSWKEINAWCERTCVDLPPWEGRLMRRLSADYLAESRRAEDEFCPPPWLAPASEATIRAELRVLDMVLG